MRQRYPYSTIWLCALCLLATVACAPVPEVSLESLPPGLRSQRVPAEGFDLHYVESGSRDDPLVLFVHGTPGSWKAFARYLNDRRLNTRAHLISVDRPGFGQSEGSGPLPLFADQSRWIGQLLSLNTSGKPAIVVGHSLGGSIAYQLAIDYPDQIGALIAISAPADPALSGPRWYNQLARIPGARWISGQDLAYSNDEMLALVNQLEPIVAALPSLEQHVTLVHGVNDGLVKVENADYAESLLERADVRYLRYEDEGHFIIWERYNDMVAEIERLLNAPL